MAIRFREAMIDDAPLVGGLLHQVEVHFIGERAPSPEAAITLVRDAIARNDGSHYTVAFDDDEPVGLACWWVVRQGPGQSSMLFLKDLFVVEAARGRSVGRALLGELGRMAIERGIDQMDFTANRKG